MLRTLFPGYFQPAEDEYRSFWNDAFIVLDTNVLLDLYRLSPNSRMRYLEILTELKDRLWIPYIVAQEFLRNRLKTITDQKAAFGKAEGLVDDLVNTTFLPSPDFRERMRKALRPAQDIVREARKSFDTLVGDSYGYSDHLLEEIEELLGGRIGSSVEDKRLSEIHREGKDRYAKQVPPGYGDLKKPEPQQYGDLVIWYEIIREASARKRPAIFVTRDVKSDWWWIHNSNHTIGPRPELRAEFIAKSGQSFYMYRSEQFLEQAGRYLDESVSKEVIEEVRDIEPAPTTAAHVTPDQLSQMAAALIAGQRVDPFSPYSQEELDRWIKSSALALAAVHQPTSFRDYLRTLYPDLDQGTREGLPTSTTWSSYLESQGFGISKPSFPEFDVNLEPEPNASDTKLQKRDRPKDGGDKD